MINVAHVDHFIDGQLDKWDNIGNYIYARWVLFHMRLPAMLQMEFRPFTEKQKLFCTYEGKRYRITGASRMGDIWLAFDFNRETGYDLRVEITQCTQFSDKSLIPVTE